MGFRDFFRKLIGRRPSSTHPSLAAGAPSSPRDGGHDDESSSGPATEAWAVPPAAGPVGDRLPIGGPPRIRSPRSPASDEAVEAFVASVRHLPLFSGTATQLMRTVGREDVSPAELARLISTDASLVAHLLRIVNSPYYGLARSLGTILEAISVLGIDQVRRTVTAAVLQRPLLSYLHETDAVRAFWRHELLCAALSRHLAEREGLNGELAYMAGLMHDVGRLAMLIGAPGSPDEMLGGRHDDDIAGTDREFERFGFDHAQVGEALLRRWGLPDAIVEVASRHADDTEPADPLCASVWRANRLSHAMVDEPDDEDVAQPWMVTIGLGVKARRQMLDEIRALESGQG